MDLRAIANLIEETMPCIFGRPECREVPRAVVISQEVWDAAEHLARFVLSLEPSAELRAVAKRIKRFKDNEKFSSIYRTTKDAVDDLQDIADAHIRTLSQLTGETQ